MANIPPTSITTDTPGSKDLNLSDGFPLFPWLGATHLGTTFGRATGTLAQKTWNFEFLKVELSAGHEVLLGALGPAYAMNLEVSGNSNYTTPPAGQPSSGQLIYTDNDLRGGFQFGVGVGLSCELEVSAHVGKINKRLVNADFGFSIDLFELLVNWLIEHIFGGGGGHDANGQDPNDFEMSELSSTDGKAIDKVDEGSGAGKTPVAKAGSHLGPPEFTAGGMVDSLSQPWSLPSGHTLTGPPANTLRPTLSFNLDLVPLCREIEPLEPIYLLNKALAVVKGGFGFGPGISLGMPTTVTIERVNIDGHSFQIQSVSGSGNSTTTAEMTEEGVDPRLQPLSDPPQEIGLTLRHQIGISVGVYFWAEFTVAKVINAGFHSATYELIDFANTGSHPSNPGGPFDSSISYKPGGGRIR